MKGTRRIFSIFLIVPIIILTIFSANPAAADPPLGPNLLLNGNFEEWETRTDTYQTSCGICFPTQFSQTDTVLMPKHWFAEIVFSCCVFPELGNVVFQGESHTGSFGLREGGFSGLPLQTGIYLIQDVPAVPGFPYVASYFTKNPTGPGARRMRGTWRDVNGNTISSAFFLGAPFSTSYILVQGTTVFAPCNAAAIRVHFDKADFGGITYDDGYFGQNLDVQPQTCAGPYQVSIDIKPGSFPNSINPKSRGKVPVAILSNRAFDATVLVDRGSLTFGRTGDEPSLAFCNTSPEDVNGDGLLDLVCHFHTLTAAFEMGDTQGTLKGELTSGTPIMGTDSIRVVP